MPGSSLLASLRTAYRVEVADHPDLVREAQRLRYQVFVRERAIFKPSSEDLLETDEFDAWSHHLLIRRCDDREAIGTARLVTPCADRPVSLPIQRVCSADHLGAIPLAGVGEISRFAISKYRRGGGDPRIDSLLLLTLVEGVLHLSLRLGLTHWCAVMERSLMRLLRSIGIHFTPLGPLVAYYGQRQPALAKIASVLEEGERQCPLYHEFVTRARHHGWRAPELAPLRPC